MNKIVAFESGSKLYGTNTAKSDTDIFCVYKESLENIILGKDKGSVFEKTNDKKDVKNTAEDVDVQYKELRTFIRECLSGQSGAVEALFVPERMLTHTSDIWNDLRAPESREKLVGDLRPIIKYCRTQARKFSQKGKRYRSLMDCLKWWKAKTLPYNNIKLSDIGEYYLDEFCQIEVKNGETFYTTAGTMFHLGVNTKFFLTNLENKVKEYGQRVRQASVDGNDWKALSHSYRLCEEYIELCEEGTLQFPLKNAQYIKNIKLGLIPVEIVESELDELFEKIETLKYNSKADQDFWNDWLVEKYKNG
jgi:hypothetical protein